MYQIMEDPMGGQAAIEVGHHGSHHPGVSLWQTLPLGFLTQLANNVLAQEG